MTARSRLSSLAKAAVRLPAALLRERQSAFFGAARRWSNREVARIAHLFDSPIVNVSAWADSDKEGRDYRDYFRSGGDYWITNFGTSQGEMQGREDEFYLDLEKPLPDEHRRRFATVFNHTTLEHVWDFKTAFANMCEMSNDAVLIIVPWLQPQHSDYGDYWRFSPQAMVRLFEEQSMTVVHLDWNRDPRQSVYVLAVGVRDPVKWAGKFAKRPLASSDPDFFTLPADFPGRGAFDL
jgi:hypothetical protein